MCTQCGWSRALHVISGVCSLAIVVISAGFLTRRLDQPSDLPHLQSRRYFFIAIATSLSSTYTRLLLPVRLSFIVFERGTYRL